MPIGSPSRQSTALFVVDYGQYCDGRSTDLVKVDAYAITNNGRMPSSLILGCSRCMESINWRANPDEETTDWRARRWKTAHRVRREGTAIAVSSPYPLKFSGHYTVNSASMSMPAVGRPSWRSLCGRRGLSTMNLGFSKAAARDSQDSTKAALGSCNKRH
jgi:hypothetical protein